MQSQPPQAAIPSPQLSTPTTVLVHSLETAFLGAVVAGVLAGYQAFAAGLSPGYIIGAGASVVFAILCKWAQSSILSNATAKQNALIAVSDLAAHVPAIHTLVANMSEDMGTLFNHLSTQAHSQPSPAVLEKVASLAAMVPALQQTLTAASTATTLAPVPVVQVIPATAGATGNMAAGSSWILDQPTQTGVPVAPQAQPSWPVVADVQQTPFPSQPPQAPLSALPPSTIPTAAIAWQASQGQ